MVIKKCCCGETPKMMADNGFYLLCKCSRKGESSNDVGRAIEYWNKLQLRIKKNGLGKIQKICPQKTVCEDQ